jgi:hypothetical protein
MRAMKPYSGQTAGLMDSVRSDRVASPRLSRRNNRHMPPRRNTDLAMINLLVPARIAFYGHPLPGAHCAP